MHQQIIRISIRQTSKVLAVLYGLMGLVLLPVFVLASFAGPDDERLGIGLAVALPLLYAVLGYVFVAIGSAVYNFVASRVGGIEIVMKAVAEQTD